MISVSKRDDFFHDFHDSQCGHITGHADEAFFLPLTLVRAISIQMSKDYFAAQHFVITHRRRYSFF